MKLMRIIIIGMLTAHALQSQPRPKAHSQLFNVASYIKKSWEVGPGDKATAIMQSITYMMSCITTAVSRF